MIPTGLIRCWCCQGNFYDTSIYHVVMNDPRMISIGLIAPCCPECANLLRDIARELYNFNLCQIQREQHGE